MKSSISEQGAADRRGKDDLARLESRGVKSASRVLAIISLLTSAPAGVTFGEVCARLELPKSSTHALLRTMTDQGFLTLDSARKYQIGIRLWEAGQTYTQAFNLADTARLFMESARDALSETVQLAVLDGIDNVYIAKVDANQALALHSRVGARIPSYATGLGKVLLSGLDDESIRQRFADVNFRQFTDATIADTETLLEVIRQVRIRGFGTDSGEYTPGVMCVAVPIRQHSGQIMAAMSVSVPEVRWSVELQNYALDALSRQAAALSKLLGFRAGTEKILL